MRSGTLEDLSLDFVAVLSHCVRTYTFDFKSNAIFVLLHMVDDNDSSSTTGRNTGSVDTHVQMSVL